MYIVPITPLAALTPLAQVDQTAQAQQQPSALPFADVLRDAMQNVEATQKVSQQDAFNLALGRTDDLHTIQINSMKADAAIDFTAGLTSKVISAYNEIIRMQI